MAQTPRTMDAHSVRPRRWIGAARAEQPTRVSVSVSECRCSTKQGASPATEASRRHITELKRAEEEHRAHVWFLESMDRINRAMQGTNDVEQMMSAVLDEVLEIFACDRAWLLYPCDPHALLAGGHGARDADGVPGAFAALEGRSANDVEFAEWRALR